ncbi:MAG: DinB family protein [Acidobacteria bacterium]|nr:DinB family protein [Acidobacteriota bacterium]
MTKTPILSILIVTALAVACGPQPAAEQPAAEQAAASSAALAVRDGALARLSGLEEKYVGLAEAMPQAKYTWRPGEGVRSVSELFLHVVSANYRLPNMIGTPPPDGMNFEGYEKSTTDQAEIVAALKASFAHTRKALENVAAADLEKAVKVFGRESTNAGAMITFNGHLSEHLGQAIAYARVNGVVPPWNK